MQECHKEEVRKVAAVSRERDEALASAQAERQALKALEVSQAAEAQQLRDLVAARDQQLQVRSQAIFSEAAACPHTCTCHVDCLTAISLPHLDCIFYDYSVDSLTQQHVKIATALISCLAPSANCLMARI